MPLKKWVRTLPSAGFEAMFDLSQRRSETPAYG
jgi:hypothetical protein